MACEFIHFFTLLSLFVRFFRPCFRSVWLVIVARLSRRVYVGMRVGEVMLRATMERSAGGGRHLVQVRGFRTLWSVLEGSRVL